MQTIAYCGGTFDLFHPGHVAFLEWVRDNFGTVIVALNTDEFVKRYKGELIQPYYERWRMLQSCVYVDGIIMNESGEDSKPTILKVCPTHIVNGNDWNRERLMVQMGLTDEFLKENDLGVVICPIQRRFSTTELKKRIRDSGEK